MPETIVEENIAAESISELPKEGFAEGLALSVSVVLEEVGDKAEFFVQEFKARYGRAPRILHIGNIANNAYGNAQLLNEVGFDCDVLCYDYYHIMGCPEWNDADFEGEIKDQFYPDWSSVNLKGYKRPTWFVQGPLGQCIKYLAAKRQKKRLKQWYYWQLLAWKRFVICNVHIRKATQYYDRLRFSFLKKLIGKILTIIPFLFKVLESLFLFTTGLCLLVLTTLMVVLLVPLCVFKKVRQFLNRVLFVDAEDFKDLSQTSTDLSKSMKWLTSRYQLAERQFNEGFPDHPYKLSTDDMMRFKSNMMRFDRIFQYYDIIHGYATDPIYPLLVGQKPYVAYEHGTIREIPFENTAVGKLTLLAYAKADALFLTNADNLPKARLMQSEERRIVKGLHKFDERRIYAQLEKIKDYPREQGRFGFADDVTVFFAPARQDHKIKGNDHILYAAQKVHQQVGDTFKVVFAAWGPDKPQAEKLVEELGLEKVIHWVEPLGTMELLNAYRSVDAVLDQFVLPCIGGLPVEVMVVGECPVITYLDDSLMAEFYGETIPLLNAHSPDEVAEAMLLVINQPEQARQVVADCVGWVNRCHTHLNLLDQLADAYRLTGVLDAPVENGK